MLPGTDGLSRRRSEPVSLAWSVELLRNWTRSTVSSSLQLEGVGPGWASTAPSRPKTLLPQRVMVQGARHALCGSAESHLWVSGH
ncbi:hypothetical protein Y1Q_0018099 [Alligator mississippiensis]|uniref:Uncharacterized protein n=1 Tax=Alligator mississippiensis TaxID=8496 RepID=A0A151MWC2_ALLMI|nr:hypothetical protein Y1Q_0018099 [Alligator mississippiensis]